MTATTFGYEEGDLLPDVSLWWQQGDGTLRDFSSGWTFEVRVGVTWSTSLFKKTTGITGATGAGTKPYGTPNLVISWLSTDLGTILVPANVPEVVYGMWVTATRSSDSKPAHYPGDLAVRIRKTST